MEGWIKVEFGRLGKKYSGLSNKKGEDFGFGKPYITYLNIFNNSCIDTTKFEYVNISPFEKQSKVKNGDIFFTVSSETIAEVGMSSVLLEDIEELYLNSFCFGFRLNDFNTIIPEYVRYLLRSNSIRHKISLCGKGSTRYNLSKTELLSNLIIDIPKDTKEQQKIASILSTIDKNIELTEQLIAKQKNIKTGLMHDLLSYGIDEKGQIRSPKTHSFVEKNGIVVPEEWDVEEIGNNLVKITTGNSNTQDKIDDGIYPLFVRSNTIERSNNYIFEGEAVLTSGDGVGVGKIFHYYNGKFNFHQRVYCISDFKEDKLFGKYFFEYFKTHFLSEVSKQSAKTTVDSVRLNMITKMKIKLPTYIEQKKIVSIIDKQDQIISEQEIKSEKLKSVKKGLMEDLLTRNVRVNY